MTRVPSFRFASIDILRGIVMVIMALDHSRAFIHFGPDTNPTNFDTTTPLLFFTRIITHFCAPVFVLLAGSAAYLYGHNKPKRELSRFLLTRGLWLILIEATVLSFAWTFNPALESLYFGVVWAIGFAMVVMAGLVYLPTSAILVTGLAIVGLHNLFDSMPMDGGSFWENFGKFMLRPQTFNFDAFRLRISYAPLPWMGAMLLGYVLGCLYTKPLESQRGTYLWYLGMGCTLVFLVFRFSNFYGDPSPWTVLTDDMKTAMSFFNLTKYPPSLLFFCFTLGPALLLLRSADRWKCMVSEVLVVFGRVPFFYYILHLYLLHCIKYILLFIRDGALGTGTSVGFSLTTTYIVWVAAVAALYLPCRWYMSYRARNRHKWWLSYL